MPSIYHLFKRGISHGDPKKWAPMVVRTFKPKSRASSTESSGPSRETETLAVAIYLASRPFKSSTIQEYMDQRLCGISDPDNNDKAFSVAIEADLHDGMGKQDVDRVNECATETSELPDQLLY